MPSFLSQSDEEIINYLVEHFDEIGVGQAPARLAIDLASGISAGNLAIVKRDEVFTIVELANRKHKGFLASTKIPPESNLMFLFATKEVRGKGTNASIVA